MSTYNLLHLSAMWGCYALACLLVSGLLLAGLVFLWHQIRRAPLGHEDNTGFHQDNGGAP